MENGSYLYALEMATPLGTRRGYLELIPWENCLNGYLTMFTRTFPIEDGKISGNHISFRGTMKTMLHTHSYTAAGKIAGNVITMVVATEKDHYHVVGRLAGEQQGGVQHE